MSSTLPVDNVLPGMIKWIYGISLLLIIAWAVGLFGLHAGNWIHILLLVGMVAILMTIVAEGQ
ncbi:MAG: lmo0937 family membrane protein [Bacteroidota bacterium]|nr:lmo0937 family membrane protein [Bacteroidota bacterium]MDP4254535.1 lmo0937 family membrane protein [Bacteroidota bacterium]